MASTLFASTGFGDGCSAGVTQTNGKKHKQKFFFLTSSAVSHLATSPIT
jgi:hypothetical protein